MDPSEGRAISCFYGNSLLVKEQKQLCLYGPNFSSQARVSQALSGARKLREGNYTGDIVMETVTCRLGKINKGA